MQPTASRIMQSVWLAVVVLFCLDGCESVDTPQAPEAVGVESSVAGPSVKEKLWMPIAVVDIQEQPLEKVFQWWSDVAGLDMTVKWSELETVGLTKDTTVTMQLQDNDQTAMMVLRQLLFVAARAEPHTFKECEDGWVCRVYTNEFEMLEFIVDDGQVVVSTQTDLALDRRMERKIVTADFRETPLENVFEWLSAKADLELEVNWDALKAAGLSKETAFTLQLEGGPLRQAYKAVFDKLDGPTPLAYDVDGEYWLFISTREKLGTEIVYRTYDYRDLVYDVAPDTPERADRVAALIKRITSEIAPGTWRGPEDDDGTGVITTLVSQEQFIIVQTRLAHRQVEELLNNLRDEAQGKVRDELNPG